MEGRWKEDGRKMEGRIPPLIVVSCSLLFAFFVAFALPLLPLLPLFCLCLFFRVSVHLPGATSSSSSSSSSSRSRAPANKGKNSREARRNQRAQKNAELDTIGKATRVRYYMVEYTNLELPSNFSSLELVLLPQNTKKPSRATKYW